MITVYFDASAILRVILGQEPALKDWDQIELGVSNEIVRVECARTFERMRLERKFSDAVLQQKRATATDFLSALELVAVDAPVLARAAQPFPTHVATLDAIHLATAVLFQDALPPSSPPLLFATHDLQLARAARALHFEVLGA